MIAALLMPHVLPWQHELQALWLRYAECIRYDEARTSQYALRAAVCICSCAIKSAPALASEIISCSAGLAYSSDTSASKFAGEAPFLHPSTGCNPWLNVLLLASL